MEACERNHDAKWDVSSDESTVYCVLCESAPLTEVEKNAVLAAECARLREALSRIVAGSDAVGTLYAPAYPYNHAVAIARAALAAQPNDDSVCLLHTDTLLEWLENDPRGRLCRCPKCDAALDEQMNKEKL